MLLEEAVTVALTVVAMGEQQEEAEAVVHTEILLLHLGKP
jgi:hypothetical protein